MIRCVTIRRDKRGYSDKCDNASVHVDVSRVYAIFRDTHEVESIETVSKDS